MQFSSIQPINMTIPGATIPGQSGPVNNGIERVLRIPQITSITENSPSDCLVLLPWYSLRWGACTSAEVQSVYSTAPADWATIKFSVRIVFVHTVKCQNSSILNNSV